jgi:hypothetical protein
MANQQDGLAVVAWRDIDQKGPHVVHHLSIALAARVGSMDVLRTLELQASHRHPVQREDAPESVEFQAIRF